MKNKTIDDYFDIEQKRLETERRENVKGYRAFFVAPVGETHMTLLYRVPRLIETKYGPRNVFSIIVDGSDYDFTVNEKSPLYHYFIRSLAESNKDIELVLVRTGNGKSTRYSVKEA